MHAQGRVDGYIRIFNDEFNGNFLDKNEYYYHYSRRAFESCCRLLDTAYEHLENGLLRLKMIYAPNSSCDIKTDFKNQEVWTFRRYKYGRFSIRARIDYGKGIFPAFWLFGGSTAPKIQPYTEIDIFEAYVADKELESNVHIYDTTINCDNHPTGRWKFKPGQWYNYTFNWTPDSLNLYIDGKFIKTLYNSAFLGNMNIILNIGSFPSLKKLKKEEMPLFFDVDYLTIDYPIDTTQIVKIDTFESNYGNKTVFTGKKIKVCETRGKVVFKGNPSRYHGYNMDLVATESISFKPGFHAEENSNFRAWIINTTTLIKK
jgi:hypothetical protein